MHHKRDNLEAFVNRGGLVKVAFFGGLDNLQRIQDPQQAAGSRVRVASIGRLGWHEDAGDSSSGKLEGLRGYSRSNVAWDRSADSTGGSQSDRQKVQSGDKHSGPSVLWRRDTRSGPAGYAAESTTVARYCALKTAIFAKLLILKWR